MDLYEIEGKKLLKEFGIPTDEGFLYTGETRPAFSRARGEKA